MIKIAIPSICKTMSHLSRKIYPQAAYFSFREFAFKIRGSGRNRVKRQATVGGLDCQRSVRLGREAQVDFAVPIRICVEKNIREDFLQCKPDIEEKRIRSSHPFSSIEHKGEKGIQGIELRRQGELVHIIHLHVEAASRLASDREASSPCRTRPTSSNLYGLALTVLTPCSLNRDIIESSV
jgi:hypothetical protein